MIAKMADKRWQMYRIQVGRKKGVCSNVIYMVYLRVGDKGNSEGM